MFREKDLTRLQDSSVKRLVVGISGGIDSMVLLDLACTLKDLPVTALHINHHLHPQADEFETFCRSAAGKYQIEVNCMSVAVSTSGSLETSARQARYTAFEQFLVEGDLLLLAHHRDDQVETLLFRLFRGSRVLGLEGMPRERSIGPARLYRPLLDCSRAEIEQYAAARGLAWREDPTNLELSADRNFIRHELLPLAESRFPGVRHILLDGLARDDAARELIGELYADQLLSIRDSPDALRLKDLRRLDSAMLPNLFTAWLDGLGLPQPTGRMLAELTRIIKAGDRVDMETGSLAFRDWHEHLYVLRTLPAMVPLDMPLIDRQEVPGGWITNDKTKGYGLRGYGPRGHGLRSPDSQDTYRIRSRVGGERFRSGKRRDLKKIFQANGTPIWLRDRVPLIYAGDDLVALAAIPGWGIPMEVADGWVAGSGESGCQVALQLNDRFEGAAGG